MSRWLPQRHPSFWQILENTRREDKKGTKKKASEEQVISSLLPLVLWVPLPALAGLWAKLLQQAQHRLFTFSCCSVSFLPIYPTGRGQHRVRWEAEPTKGKGQEGRAGDGDGDRSQTSSGCCAIAAWNELRIGWQRHFRTSRPCSSASL